MKNASLVRNMSAGDYAREFPEITVGLNWDRFASEGWPVHHRIVTDREELLEYFTFFRCSLGRIMPRFFHWLASRQMRIRDVLKHVGRIPDEHRASLDYFADNWRDGTGPIEMSLPTYRIGESDHFILDGNHRACALALSDRPFRLDLFSIEGPMDRQALVDAVNCR